MIEDTCTIAVAVNSDDQLRNNLLRSPGLNGRHQVILKRGFSSAALAYNSAIDEAGHDIVIFIHQDMYLPAGWFDDLGRALAFLEETDVRWGVLGCFGSRKGVEGGLGRLYTQGRGWHGRRLGCPEPVETLDEIVLIIRRSSGLRFDPRLPHFHFYGTDLCMAARERGLVNYAFQGAAVHNTNQLLMLPAEFYVCYAYVRKKWAKHLPIVASCMTVSSLNGALYRRRILESGRRLLRRPAVGARRVEDPRPLCHAQD